MTERALQRIVRAGQAILDQIDRVQRAARGVGELQRQRDRAFAVRLHRASGVRVGEAQNVGERAWFKPLQASHSHRSAVNAGYRRAEEPQTALRGNSQPGGDVYPDRDCGKHVVGLARAGVPVECSKHGGYDRGHRMDHRSFVNRVPFKTVDRKTIDIGCSVGGQTCLDVAEQAADTVAAPAFGGRQHAGNPGTGPTRRAHRKRICDKPQCCFSDRCREPMRRSGKIPQVGGCAHRTQTP